MPSSPPPRALFSTQQDGQAKPDGHAGTLGHPPNLEPILTDGKEDTLLLVAVVLPLKLALPVLSLSVILAKPAPMPFARWTYEVTAGYISCCHILLRIPSIMEL
mmetsp:Transcript_43674/g.100787  ORF Transcript_43674/g.100787 Transcript_43674/m.100787 type:complete len:104 (-) Transcript_43674:20-331(-)